MSCLTAASGEPAGSLQQIGGSSDMATVWTVLCRGHDSHVAISTLSRLDVQQRSIIHMSTLSADLSVVTSVGLDLAKYVFQVHGVDKPQIDIGL
jgi:hypothetical protein